MKYRRTIILIAIILCGCKKPYNPPAITGNGGYLVVEGIINSGSDSTAIKLSKTVNVASKVTTNPVLHAAVSVESDQGATFPLTETTNGSYVSAGLNLDNSRTYRLNIKTSDNKQYQSDLAPVIVTPTIDSVGFNIVTLPVPGIQIYANTHDPSNLAKYFRWDYDENWTFHAKYVSYYVATSSGLGIRSPAQAITYCYANDVSSDIVLGSSAKLQQDIIYQAPIVFIPSTSEKIETEYSILLRQYALTPNAYNFWINLKKNTEQLGSIFDAQPSQLEGNIHCITDPSEPVIGYISVCAASSKRTIISNLQLPAWVPAYPYSCEQDSLKTEYDVYNTVVLDSAHFIATGPPPVNGAIPLPLAYSTHECVDCTIRGTRKRPPFFK